MSSVPPEVVTRHYTESHSQEQVSHSWAKNWSLSVHCVQPPMTVCLPFTVQCTPHQLTTLVLQSPTHPHPHQLFDHGRSSKRLSTVDEPSHLARAERLNTEATHNKIESFPIPGKTRSLADFRPSEWKTRPQQTFIRNARPTDRPETSKHIHKRNGINRNSAYTKRPHIMQNNND